MCRYFQHATSRQKSSLAIFLSGIEKSPSVYIWGRERLFFRNVYRRGHEIFGPFFASFDLKKSPWTFGIMGQGAFGLFTLCPNGSLHMRLPPGLGTDHAGWIALAEKGIMRSAETEGKM